MSTEHYSPAAMPLPPAHFSAIRAALRGRHQLTLTLGALLFTAVTLALLLGPGISPYEASEQDLLHRLQGPSAAHWLGTDELGRDLLSRLLNGGQFSVSIAAISLLLCVATGVAIGIICARAGGWIDELGMRSVDLLIAFPDVVVAIFLTAVFGPSYITLIASLAIVGWTPFARMARDITLVINGRDFIQAAESLGCRRRFIILHHVLPNALRPIAALTFLRFGHKLITVGGLSYLGLGVQPPHADWALMLASGKDYFERAPMLAIAPGIAMLLTALSVTWIGQGLESRRH